MVTKKEKSWMWGVFIVLIIVAITYYSTGFTIFQQQIWKPDFGRIKCEVYPLDLQSGIIPTSGGSLICGDNAYIPSTCTYHITQQIGGLVSVSECAVNSDDCKTLQYSLLGGGGSGSEKSYTIESGKRIYINPTIREAKVRLTANSYKLHQIDSGFEIIDNKGCSLTEAKAQSILDSDPNNKNIKTTTYNGNLYLVPDGIFHYISSLQPAVSGNAVTIQGINGGNPIYIYDIGRYYPISKVESGQFAGQLVVDTYSPKEDSKIQCLPAQPFCSPEAKKILPTEKKCTDTLGNTGEYIPKTNSEYCKLECDKSTGSLKYSSDCKVIKPCEDNKPFRNQKTLECEAGITPIIEQQTDFDFRPLFVIGIIFIIAVILILIAKKKRR